MKQIAPPEAPAIEKDVLSVLCNRPELIQSVEEVLNIECFYNSDYQYLFDVIFKIHLEGGLVSQSSILHQIIPSGKKDILATYQEMKKFFTTEKNLLVNANILAEYATKRSLLNKAHQIINMIDSNESIDDIEREVHETEMIVISRNNNVDAVSMSEAVDGLIELMNRKPVNGITGIPTGVPLLDRITGGWEYDDVVIIAGRPGMGKTASATFHSHFAAQAGFPTAFLSLEVKPEKLVGRMLSNTTGFSSSDITKGRVAENQRTIIVNKGNEARSLPIYFYDNARSRDINDICRTMRTWHRKYGLKIIFIDYIGLIKDRTIRDSSNKTSVIESVQSKLTELRAQLGIPIIIFSQLNREAEGKTDRRPALHNLKNSGKLEEDGTRVIFLYRQDYYDANEAKDRGDNFVPSHDMEYIFAKNREGELGPILLKCNVALNRVYEQPSAADIEKQLRDYSKNASLRTIEHKF